MHSAGVSPLLDRAVHPTGTMSPSRAFAIFGVREIGEDGRVEVLDRLEKCKRCRSQGRAVTLVHCAVAGVRLRLVNRRAPEVERGQSAYEFVGT